MAFAGIQEFPGQEGPALRGRAWRFTAALAVSLVLHGVLFLDIAVFPAGRPMAPPQRPAPPLVVNEVRSMPDLSGFLQPDRFRPATPEAFAGVEALQQDLLEEWHRMENQGEVFTPPPPAEATIPPPEPMPSAPLDFRQEMLQIERIAAASELETLPRRVVAAAPRMEQAPDITLAADLAALAAAAESGGPAASGLGLPPALAPASPGPAARVEPVVPSSPAEAERAQEQARMLDEAPEDITDIQPIERLLAVEVMTYRALDEQALYFEFSISRAGVQALPVLPKDVLLIQDCSESITRSKLDFFKDGLVEYLRTLTTVDRINVMRYSDTPALCFPDWQPVTTESLTQAAAFVEEMRARGQTDLFTPLQQVLRHYQPSGRPMIAVLLTDGRPTMGVVDSSDIIARFSRANAGRVSVFTVGAGDRVNAFLLDLLAHNNRGGSWIMPRREEIPRAVQRTARELSRPVLANLTYRFSGDSAVEVYPGTLTHLYLDRPLRLVGRTPLGQKTAVLQIVGESGPQRSDMVFALDLSLAEDGGEGIRREWVAQKIYKLINDHLASGRDEVLREIRHLSDRHNVPLPYGADFPL